jgi:FkbM family methyltransferase
MTNFFDVAVHYLGKNNPNTFVMNIGAMDGVMFDELIGYTTMYNFKGLYVEPMPYLFDKLKNNIPNDGNLFENSAISDYNGEIEMITIDKEVIDQGLVHSCFYGMSAVYPPKNGLGSEFDKPTVDKYGQKVTVKCITLDKLLRKHNITKIDVFKVDAEGHDYIIFKQIDFDEYRPKVIRLEWINLTETEQNEIKKKFESANYKYEISSQDIVGIPSEFYDELTQKNDTKNGIIIDSNLVHVPKKISKTTLVTGLWDIGRGELAEGWSRTFNHYVEKFVDLLKVKENMIIFGDEELEKIVFQYRNQDNTQFVLKKLDWFKNNEYYNLIQSIRTNPNWYNQVSWLSESTQARLEMYNPLVMSKMFLLHDAKILDKFDSDYMFWIDAGLTNTVHYGYFTHDNVIDKLTNKVNKFAFICFPYETTTEIHGFKYPEINNYAGTPVKKVARGGFFGGPKDSIAEINSIYYKLLNETLREGYMGTEESIFSIIVYRYPDLTQYFEIDGNGLLGKFFEDCKNEKLTPLSEKKEDSLISLDLSKVALYVITFNSPKQFKTLIDSMVSYDKNFIEKPIKYLLNNSTDRNTDDEYRKISEEYGFQIIWPKENLGITGGRQFIASHFDSLDLDFYFFFEDDMFFFDKKDETCKNGFSRYTQNLYNKVLEISQKENFDFLKMNFTEFYGDNSTQWSWYNVPQVFRESHWPNNKKLPQMGIDPNAPKTQFKEIKSHKGVPYASGEIYLCNWPILFTKKGNYKCYLETVYASPFEQTLMSHNYQETIKGKVSPGILLMSPTEHNRFEHYDASLRKEC